MKNYRIGLIGTGGIAHAHLAGYRSVIGDAVTVSAACDPRANVLDDFCNRYGIAHRFADAASLIDSGTVDLIVILTPPQVRDEVLYPAYAAGVHVLVEKPFGEDFARAARYVRDADAAGVTLAVGQNFRWFPEHQWLWARTRDEGMGPIGFIEHRCYQNRPQPSGVWRAEQQRLEMAIFSIHLIDRVQWVAGSVPTTVSAVTRRDARSDLPGEQFTSLQAQFSDGVVAQMTSSWLSKCLPTNEMRVDTERGTVTVRREGPMQHDAVGHSHIEGREADVALFPDQDEVRHGPRTYGSSMLEFVRSLDQGREPSHSGRDNLRTMAIMDAAYLSAGRGGEQVAISEIAGDLELTPARQAAS